MFVLEQFFSVSENMVVKSEAGLIPTFGYIKFGKVSKVCNVQQRVCNVELRVMFLTFIKVTPSTYKLHLDYTVYPQ